MELQLHHTAAFHRRLVLLSVVLHLVHGQDPSNPFGPAPTEPPPEAEAGDIWSRIVVSNGLRVHDSWFIKELEFYFTARCTGRKIETGTGDDSFWFTDNRRDFPKSGFRKAFDGRLETNWTSDCKEVLGGCPVESVYIGQNIMSLQRWKKANELNATRKKKEKRIQIKCIKIHQADEAKWRTGIVLLQTGSINIETGEWDRTTIRTFYDVSGGVGAIRPAPPLSLWRINNLMATNRGKWGISELEFHDDVLCTSKMYGKTISSMPVHVVDHGPDQALDGDESTYFMASCPELTDTLQMKDGCFLREAWLGFDYSKPSMPRCLRLFQAQHLIDAYEPELVLGVALQYWDGTYWQDFERFWREGIGPYASMYTRYERPTLLSPYMAVGAGHWESTVPADNAAWRIVNENRPAGENGWQVHEVEFYLNSDCEGAYLEGEAISSLARKGYPSKGAFDTAESEENNGKGVSWWADCKWRNGKCDRYEAWVGLYFRVNGWKNNAFDGQHDVRCFRVYQSSFWDRQVEAIELSTWNNGAWDRVELYRHFGGGSFQKRPAAPWTMWRVVNDAPIGPGQWRVHEIQGFRHPDCMPTKSDTITKFSAISSGFFGKGSQPQSAFDGISSTGWGANCHTCNMTNAYWVGQQMDDSELKELGEKVLRCFRIWQSPLFAEQSSKIRIDQWDGRDFVKALHLSKYGNFGGGGGGIWNRHPVKAGLKWRLVKGIASAEDAELRRLQEDFSESPDRWQIYEVKLYADASCKWQLGGISDVLPDGGATWNFAATPVSSGYLPERSDTDAMTAGALSSEMDHAFDGDTKTSVNLEHRPWYGYPAWLGVDFLVEPVQVQCIRLLQGGLETDYANVVNLQMWDGDQWVTDPEQLAHEGLFEGLGGGGWQRRPAKDGTIWRLENAEKVSEGWAIHEVHMYDDPNCKGSWDYWMNEPQQAWDHRTNATHQEGLRGQMDIRGGAWIGSGNQPLQGSAISSGYLPPLSEYGPDMAFDGDLNTYWLPQCAAFRGNSTVPLGCSPGEAWLGLDFGMRQIAISCVRIRQSANRNQQSETVHVSRWTGSTWLQMWSFGGLGGSQWEQRPIPANSMWRVLHVERREKLCRNEKSRTYLRSWGVTELKFFSDDECTKELSGRPISSGDLGGGIWPQGKSYGASSAFDGNEETHWAANCLAGHTGAPKDQGTVDCESRKEWLGLNFINDGDNLAVEVRCFKIFQSRSTLRECCDPASTVELQRWNGQEWVGASWRHEPIGEKPNEHLGAVYTNLGSCAVKDATAHEKLSTFRESRNRRQSEECSVPLTGSTALLGEPACIEHPDCVAVFGSSGECCPLNGGAGRSRCCCSYLQMEAVFDDEIAEDHRDVIDLEYAMIELSIYLPFIGLGIGVIVAAVSLVSAFAHERLKTWQEEMLDDEKRHRRILGYLGYVLVPVTRFRLYLGANTNKFQKLCHWFFFFEYSERIDTKIKYNAMRVVRIIAFLVCAFFLFGLFPWLTIGVLFSRGILRFLMLMSVIIRKGISPFDTDCEGDMELRRYVVGVELKSEGTVAQIVDVGREFVIWSGLSVVHFLKFVFDLLLLRAQMIALGIAAADFTVEQLLSYFPAIVRPLKDIALIISDVTYWISNVFSVLITLTVGIPKCEGPCIILGSIFLIAVLLVLVQWLNFDFFGLFQAAKQSVKTSRPPCQRVASSGLIFLCQSIVFGGIQCTMLFFARALIVANPFRQTPWACEHDDSFAILLGRVIIMATSLAGMGMFFLCANGHFMGQDYILKPLGKHLHMNLDALDPDGAGAEGGLVRWGVLMSMVPTTLGLWLDDWNVDGFLVDKRAQVYAKQLRDPQACLGCGQLHTPYDHIMRATGKQVSLSWQILPCGILIGKASEYLNDPPTFYTGNLMPCSRILGAATGLPDLDGDALDRKNAEWWVSILLFIAQVCTLSVKLGIPIARRIVGMMLYAWLLVGTFGLSADSLDDNGEMVFRGAMGLALAKAAGEGFASAVLSCAIGLIALAIPWYDDSAREGSKKDSLESLEYILGQLITGIVVSVVIAVSLPLGNNRGNGFGSDTSDALGITLGIWNGQIVATMTILASFGLSDSSDIVFVVSMKLLYLALLGSALGAVAMNLGIASFVQAFVLIVVVLAIQLVNFQGVLRTVPGDDRVARKKKLMNAILSRRILSSVLGVIVGTVVGGSMGLSWARSYNLVFGMITGIIIGLVSGIIFGLAVDRVHKNLALLTAMICGLAVCLAVGIWSWLIGMFAGVVVGALVGSVIEHWDLLETQMMAPVEDGADAVREFVEHVKNKSKDQRMPFYRRKWSATRSRSKDSRKSSKESEQFEIVKQERDELREKQRAKAVQKAHELREAANEKPSVPDPPAIESGSRPMPTVTAIRRLRGVDDENQKKEMPPVPPEVVFCLVDVETSLETSQNDSEPRRNAKAQSDTEDFRKDFKKESEAAVLDKDSLRLPVLKETPAAPYSTDSFVRWDRQSSLQQATAPDPLQLAIQTLPIPPLSIPKSQRSARSASKDVAASPFGTARAAVGNNRIGIAAPGRPPNIRSLHASAQGAQQRAQANQRL